MSKPVIPIQTPLFREDDFKPENSYQFINQWATQVTNAANLANGAVGPSVLPAGVDVAGGKVTGLGKPTGPTDAISSGHAEANYSAPVLAQQVDVGGPSALKGLTYLYLQMNKGASGTIPLAKLTGGGSNGSITVSSGLITAFVAPT
jgi:hypothetical protein